MHQCTIGLWFCEGWDWRNGKVWIEQGGLEEGVAQELVEAGIPKEDIVPSFFRPERRKFNEFAVVAIPQPNHSIQPLVRFPYGTTPVDSRLG